MSEVRSAQLHRTIAVVADHYLPGWRAGGPIRSLSNMVEALGTEYDFRMITSDRDHLSDESYPDIDTGRWSRVGKAKVFYGASRDLTFLRLSGVLRSSAPRLVFANSLFSPLTLRLLMARRLGRVRHPILIAPRGELSIGALSLKSRRKTMYLMIARLTGLFRDVTFQASSSSEAVDIDRRLGRDALIAADIPAPPAPEPAPSLAKEPGSVRLVFTARVSPMKNLAFLIDALSQVRGDVRLDVYGPAETAEMELVGRSIQSLPSRVSVVFHGAAHPDEIAAAIERSHFSVLPSRGENFGHSIFEALRIGRPVVISDRTPWQGLETAGAGWVLPLEPSDWITGLQHCVDMSMDAYESLTQGAHRYAVDWYQRSSPVSEQDRVFKVMLGL